VTGRLAAAPATVPGCALELIRRFEGLHDGDRRTPTLLEPEPDPAGIYTVGWGYALFEGGRPVTDPAKAAAIWRSRWPQGFTRVQAEALLADTALEVCVRVRRLLPGVRLADHELGALTSLAYNIGVGEDGGRPDFADSSVRRRLLAGDRRGAADAFRMWRVAGGRILPGLVRRREAERSTFLGPRTP